MNGPGLQGLPGPDNIHCCRKPPAARMAGLQSLTPFADILCDRPSPLANDRKGIKVTAMADMESYAVGLGTLALLNAGIAQGKNRSGLIWFLVSLLLGPIATFILVAFCKKLPEKQSGAVARCPKCGRAVAQTTRVCPRCEHRLIESSHIDD